MIPFNVPYLTGRESEMISKVLQTKKLAGDGAFTRQAQAFFESQYQFGKCLLTSSCTDALEMAALLLEIRPGDEVIMPSYTFVSTASAFVLRGAEIVFADSSSSSPNVSVEDICSKITARTKAIVVVHYGGVAVDMNSLLKVCEQRGIALVEDAAHSVDSFYQGKSLGSVGHISTFSFHETKNINCGEGGMLVVNDPRFFARAEILREKGTNRSAFFRGEVDKYNWVDVGSSFLPSEYTAALLCAQIEDILLIQKKRIEIWQQYSKAIACIDSDRRPQVEQVPSFATNNAHLFYLVCKNLEERTQFMKHMNENGIKTTFHYQPLHASPYFLKNHKQSVLPQAERYGDCLVRLPLYPDLSDSMVNQISDSLIRFFQN